MDDLLKPCAGLPLALTVLGKAVGKAGPGNAAGVASRLREGKTNRDVEHGLHEVLHNSYELLDKDSQLAFLDVVCLYQPTRTPWGVVEAALDGAGRLQVGFTTSAA